jgi:hypothetical protein
MINVREEREKRINLLIKNYMVHYLSARHTKSLKNFLNKINNYTKILKYLKLKGPV